MSYLRLWLMIDLLLVEANTNMYSVKAKLIDKSRFEPPKDLHFIETVNNTRSASICISICDRHIICRTADYSLTTKQCRLFESLASAGNFLSDPTTVILALNYCQNDNQIEPYYICSRSGKYTVQQLFDLFALSSNIAISSTNRGVYINMHGVYTSNYVGSFSFFTYNGVKITLDDAPNEITNINAATRNGMAIVRYQSDVIVIYKNIGSPSQPNLVQTNSFPLSGPPYSCLVTSQYFYVTYSDGATPLTVHDLSSGSVLYSDQTLNSAGFRPVVAQWKDLLIILDQYKAKLYNLTGAYIGNLPYFTSPQAGARHYIDHDYAGRRYICNDIGTNPGIYAFLLNGTQIGQGDSSCNRAFQIYITKQQAIYVSASTNIGTRMKVINI